MRNRLYNTKNRYQGNYKRILCVCSAGLLRSPTLALVLANKGYNTRACGAMSDMALIPIDEVLMDWADEIVFVEEYAKLYTRVEVGDVEFEANKHKFITLEIPDMYEYRDPELMAICEEQYEKAINERNTSNDTE